MGRHSTHRQLRRERGVAAMSIIMRGISLALLVVAAMINDAEGSYMLIFAMAGVAALLFIASLREEDNED